jgi:outer membrane receptor protein involved in Fe transport
MPAAQLINLPEALVTLAPGMIRGHDDFVHVRGHEIALNPILNGVSFWENPHSLFSGGVSPDVIDTANVMTGGFASEYGNRFGGVVDIVTKSGFRLEDPATVTLNAGGAGRRSVSGEFGGHRERLAYYVFGGAHGSDRFLSPPDRVAIHDQARGAHAFAQIDGKLAGGAGMRALVMVDGVNFQIPRTPLDLEVRPEAAASQRTRQQTAIVGWTSQWANTFMSASGYERWSRSRLAPAPGPLTAQASLDRELMTVGGKLDTTASLGRHTLKAGADLVRLSPREHLEYRYGGYRDLTHLLALPHIHIEGQAIAFAADDAGGQISGYLQDTLRVGTRITADLGVRLDHYSLIVSATEASPRLNVAVELGRAVMHASYNRFFVPPPIEGVLSSSAGLTRAIQEIGVGLPALEPTREDQVEAGVSAPLSLFHASLTGYYRATDNPVHTTVWPDSRIYSYASFDRARARGLELKAEVPELVRLGMTGFLNYALGRVDFYNPVTGGFVTEVAHVAGTNRFPAPMDQTHTLTAGWTYSHGRSGAWLGTTAEYGSGTPLGHGGPHEHAEGTPAHADAVSAGGASRIPGHFTGNMSLGLDLLRSAGRAARLSLQLDVQNVADQVYTVAQEGAFSPRQYSLPRVASVTAKIRF